MARLVEIVPATQAHVDELEPNLRPEDVAEGEALGLDRRVALQDSVDESEEAYALLFDGEVAALFGVCAIARPALVPPDRWIIWLLSGHAVTRHPKAFVRACKEFLPKLLERYPHLVNVVDARYGSALRWLKRLGFDVQKPRPMGPHNMDFCLSGIRRP